MFKKIFLIISILFNISIISMESSIEKNSKESNKQVCFDLLPDELKIQIFSYLTDKYFCKMDKPTDIIKSLKSLILDKNIKNAKQVSKE